MPAVNDLKNKIDFLKDNFPLSSLKGDFEAEGISKVELCELKELSLRTGVDLFVKIGGCEAVSDLKTLKEIGVDGIVSPMIESAFAISKFVGAFNRVFGDDKKIVKGINLESVTAFENCEEILNFASDKIDLCIVGRVDFSASCGLFGDDVNSEVMTDRVKIFLKKINDSGIKSAFGGGIYPKSLPHLREMITLSHSFENRKTIFKSETEGFSFEELVFHAMDFERLQLLRKCELLGLDKEDEKRLENIKLHLKHLEEIK